VGQQLEQLCLPGTLASLAQVPPWVETLASRYAISPRTAFASNLCLEEALSNIVRHGYKTNEDQSIVVEFRHTEKELTFTIVDSAPHFRPGTDAAIEPSSLEELQPGGLGIPLMRKFADFVKWEPLEKGNRLTLGFARQR